MSSTGDKNSHARWRNLLEKHIDGELDAPDRMELFGHLEDCDECRETLEAEERLIDRLTRLPKLSAPSDLRAAILREAARERAETLQPLTDDARYVELLRGPELGSGESGIHTNTDREAESAPRLPASIVSAAGRGSSSRRRKGWSRYSPRLATAFLIASVALTVLVRVFPQLPGGEWAGLRTNPSVSTVFGALVSVAVPQREAELQRTAPEETSREVREIARVEEDVPARENPTHASHGSVDDRPLLQVMQQGHELQDLFRRDMERAGLPLPAEQELSVAETLILKIPRSGASANNGKQLADALEHSLRMQLGGEIRQYKQSERGGECSRAFTVDLPEASCLCLQEALRPFRNDVDEEEPELLASAGLHGVTFEKISRFTGPAEALIESLKLQSGTAESKVGTTRRRLLILVSE